MISKERKTLRMALIYGVLFSAAVFTYFFLGPNFAAPSLLKGAEPWSMKTLILLSCLTGMGLGTQVSLFLANRHRLRGVLRANSGRILSTIALTTFAPVFVFGLMPVSLGYGLVGLPNRLMTNQTRLEDLSGIFTVLSFSALYIFILYFFSCLIISGVQRYWVRIAIFGQVWFMLYAGVLLMVGWRPFYL